MFLISLICKLEQTNQQKVPWAKASTGEAQKEFTGM